MNLHGVPSDPRLHELLAGHVLGDLDASERGELLQLAHTHGIDLETFDYTSLDLAAANVLIAHAARDAQPLPPQLRDRLFRAADDFVASLPAKAAQVADRSSGHTPSLRIAPAPVVVQGRASLLARAGWLAAAAAMLLAAVAWWNRPVAPSELTYDRFVQATPDIVRAAWKDWDQPEVSGVKGEVVWSDSRQTGFMRFTGLPANLPTAQQYQLWIVDERGLVDSTGQSARISGGVFDVPAGSGGEVVVPIKSALKVGKAQLFALTIEKPGGTWVSDMKRRVVIAAVERKPA